METHFQCSCIIHRLFINMWITHCRPVSNCGHMSAFIDDISTFLSRLWSVFVDNLLSTVYTHILYTSAMCTFRVIPDRSVFLFFLCTKKAPVSAGAVPIKAIFHSRSSAHHTCLLLRGFEIPPGDRHDTQADSVR